MENNEQNSRRDFIRKATLGTIGLATMGMSTSSYARILG
ncbi:MAG: twin-arginine translocation signal domain-containing protein, partial [Adhaeribacter sp.]